MISEDRRVRVTAQGRQAKAPIRCSKAVFEIAAPVLESRTPTGTEPQAPDKVRMEAGRVGGIGNRMSGPAHKVRPLLRLPLVGDARCWWHGQKAFFERRYFETMLPPPVGRPRAGSVRVA